METEQPKKPIEHSVTPEAKIPDYVSFWELAPLIPGLVPTALKGAEIAWKGGELALDWIRKEGPLSAQVFDSSCSKNSYVVKFRIRNMTIHGIYLLDFRIEWPEVDPYSIKIDYSNKQKSIDFGSKDPEDSESIKTDLLQPAESVILKIEFPLPKTIDRDIGLWGKPSSLGVGYLMFWMLDKEEPSDPKKLTFALRINRSTTDQNT